MKTAGVCIMRSIMQESKDRCYLCGKRASEEHHVFGRSKQEYGLKVYLCHFCHNEPPMGVHFNSDRMEKLKKDGEEMFILYYNSSISEFIRIFGKNYI